MALMPGILTGEDELWCVAGHGTTVLDERPCIALGAFLGTPLFFQCAATQASNLFGLSFRGLWTNRDISTEEGKKNSIFVEELSCALSLTHLRLFSC